MKDDAFREFVLELAGPTRDRAKLARLLGVSESTAYGWLALSERGTFAPTTSVRGEANKLALALLTRAAEEAAAGASLAEIETRLERDTSARTSTPVAAPEGAATDAPRRQALQRGLEYALARLRGGASADQTIAAVEAVLAMTKEAP